MSLKKINSIIFLSWFLINSTFASNSITVTDAWSPEAPPVTTVMAGYMKIINSSHKDIKVQSASSPLFKKVEIHLMSLHNGMMKMTKQASLNIKAKSYIELKSGALHMMLIGRKKPIVHGTVIPVTLSLDNKEKIKINLFVSKTTPEKHHH